MQDHLHFIGDQVLGDQEKPVSTAVSVVVSMVLHASLLLVFAFYRPPAVIEPKNDVVRFVEILRQQPQEPAFTEAPGPQLEAPPSPAAPYSDANRRASAPEPTGDQPTRRPGDGSQTYIPGDPRPRAQQPTAAQAPLIGGRESAEQQPEDPGSSMAYQVQVNKANAAATVNWSSAIREVGKMASLGDGMGAAGGDPGFAESGPISFESQWYEWGDYAQHMVARIRHNWYSNMPSIIRLGVRGVVTIQFTIQRNGSITDVNIVSTSEVPPFDLAARKAIELSSPLNPLPADFPNRSERVTAQFYYNMTPPTRR